MRFIQVAKLLHPEVSETRDGYQAACSPPHIIEDSVVPKRIQYKKHYVLEGNPEMPAINARVQFDTHLGNIGLIDQYLHDALNYKYVSPVLALWGIRVLHQNLQNSNSPELVELCATLEQRIITLSENTLEDNSVKDLLGLTAQLRKGLSHKSEELTGENLYTLPVDSNLGVAES